MAPAYRAGPALASARANLAMAVLVVNFPFALRGARMGHALLPACANASAAGWARAATRPYAHGTVLAVGIASHLGIVFATRSPRRTFHRQRSPRSSRPMACWANRTRENHRLEARRWCPLGKGFSPAGRAPPASLNVVPVSRASAVGVAFALTARAVATPGGEALIAVIASVPTTVILRRASASKAAAVLAPKAGRAPRVACQFVPSTALATASARLPSPASVTRATLAKHATARTAPTSTSAPAEESALPQIGAFANLGGAVLPAMMRSAQTIVTARTRRTRPSAMAAA